MQQYFIKQTATAEDLVLFDEQQVHHLTKVMRYQSGAEVLVVDQNQNKYVVALRIENKTVVGKIVRKILQESEFPVEVVIAQALIKGDRFDYFLQKCAEFGATRIIPLLTNRVVVKVQEEKSEKKQKRWQTIAMEAAEQSRRTRFPMVEQAMSLKQLLSMSADYKIVAYEEALDETGALRQVIGKIKAELQINHSGAQPTILFVAGSEGGFDPTEIASLVAAGFLCCSLGPRILRAESASLYFLSALSYELELSDCAEIK